MRMAAISQRDMMDRIDRRLQEIGKTHVWLADRLGVTEVSISRWFSCDREPKWSAIAEIAVLIEASTDYLIFGETGKKEKEQQETRKLQKNGWITKEDAKMAIEILDYWAKCQIQGAEL